MEASSPDSKLLTSREMDFVKKRLFFWDKLSPQEAQTLTSSLRAMRASKGQLLQNGDGSCLGLLLIQEGVLRVYITSPEGREITLYRLPPGSLCIFTASCILKDVHFDVAVEAESDCLLLQISAPAISSVSDSNLHAQLFSYQIASERFSDILWALQQILFTSFDRRLAHFLLTESRLSGDGAIHMTHEQIARYLGSAREVVSRMLKYFSNEGYVQLFRGQISITDRTSLAALADEGC